MTTEDLSKIKERIAKLLRMAEDVSSPNEAAIAASRARKLMDKYQLDTFDLGEALDQEFGTVNATRFFAAIPVYLSAFAVSCANYNDCQARFSFGSVDFKKKAGEAKKIGKCVTFMGYKNDVELAAQMYSYICDCVDSLAKKYFQGAGYTKYPVGLGKAFKLTAFNAVAARMESMTKERDALEATPGNSLVLFKKAAVDAHFGEVNYGQVKHKSLSSEESRAASKAGYEAGHKIKIREELE